MSETNLYLKSPIASYRRKPVRWLSVLVGLGIILVSGTVVADVVLAYTANNSVGANAASPFMFQGGSNYAAANALGFVTNVYAGAGLTGPMVTSTISGVQSVPVELFDVTEFATAKIVPRTGTVANVNVPNPSLLAVAGVVCAYAFVSTAVPSFGGAAVAGAPAGCSATLPSLGAVASGCGVGGTAAVATVNLLTGAVSGSIAGSCTVASGTAANTLVLYVSYAITTNAAVAATTLNAFTVPVTLT